MKCRYRYLAKLAKLEKGKRVIDCACGTGKGFGVLAALKPAEFVGVDNDTEQLSICRKRRAKDMRRYKVRLELGDIRYLKHHEDNYYDYFFCCETLEHLIPRDTTKAIGAIVRITKSGGKVLVSVPGHWGSIEKPGHKQVLSLSRLKTMFAVRGCSFIADSKYQKYPERYPGRFNILAVFRKEK